MTLASVCVRACRSFTAADPAPQLPLVVCVRSVRAQITLERGSKLLIAPTYTVYSPRSTLQRASFWRWLFLAICVLYVTRREHYYVPHC